MWLGTFEVGLDSKNFIELKAGRFDNIIDSTVMSSHDLLRKIDYVKLKSAH